MSSPSRESVVVDMALQVIRPRGLSLYGRAFPDLDFAHGDAARRGDASRGRRARSACSRSRPHRSCAATSQSGWRLGRCEGAPAPGRSSRGRYPSHREGGGVVSYSVEWIPGLVVVGLVLVVLIVPPFALIGLVVVALAAVAALVALAGAVLATPYLLVRALRRRLAERPQSTDGSAAIAAAIAQAAGAANR